MKILKLIQGSHEWAAKRARHPTASEASMMMGAHRIKRGELLRMRATGTEREISHWVQEHLFDKGHEIEAKARPIAEKIVGQALYPVTATDDDEHLLASYDGLTLLEADCWECKSWNEAKAADVREGRVPEEDKWQVVQQLAIGPKRCLYMVTDGTEEKTVYLWVTLEKGQRERLLAGWAQFEQDVANYQHVESEPAPEGKAPETLPALRIEVQGMVTASNLEEFRARALTVIGAVNTDLQTDEDFANADKAVKWCKEVETRLEAAKEHALSQTASIDELFRTLDQIKAEARAKRLDLDKLVKARKESVREEIRIAAVNALREHYATINATFGGRVVLGVPAAFGPDVGAAMKGKKTIASLRDAADTALAHAKIDANTQADRVRLNLQTLESAPAHLFPDAATLATTKAPEDLKALITVRIAEHQAAEEKRLEAERARIRAEEEAKVRQEAQRETAKATQPAAPEAPKAQPARIEPKARQGLPTDQGRPTDAAIIEVLALHYRAHESTVIAWLLDMDLNAESEKLRHAM